MKKRVEPRKSNSEKEIRRKKYVKPTIKSDEILEISLQSCQKIEGEFQCDIVIPPPSTS